jgi:hypothetical protein
MSAWRTFSGGRCTGHGRAPNSRVERTTAWVVEFAGRGEAVVRVGASVEDVNEPDRRGCPVVRIRHLAEVDLKSGVWNQDGELRCEPPLGVRTLGSREPTVRAPS